jgi:urease accessory protein
MVVSPKAGRGRLDVDLVAGLSAVTCLQSVSPLKLLSPRWRGKSVWTYTSSFGGGLVAGDRLQIDVRIGAGSRCFLGTQASTKVYRNPCGTPCVHELRADIGAAALMVLAPDPIQSFAGSIYDQKQTFRLGPGAGLVLVDWISAGRTARGERWAFQRLQSRNEIWVEDECVLVDSLYLDPQDGDLKGAYRLGRFNCLALVAVIGAPLRVESERLLQEVSATSAAARGGTRARPFAQPFLSGASALRNGVLLRFAGISTEAVGSAIARYLQFVRPLLDDDPWARKW